METLLGVLVVAASLASFACFILVLMKLFPDKGVGWGIFGIICGIYTFIWGWQNVDRHNLKNIMTLWSAAIVINIVIRVLALSVARNT